MLSWCAQPRNAIITLVAKSIEPMADRTEPIYGTKYGRLPLDRAGVVPCLEQLRPALHGPHGPSGRGPGGGVVLRCCAA